MKNKKESQNKLSRKLCRLIRWIKNYLNPLKPIVQISNFVVLAIRLSHVIKFLVHFLF